MIQKKISKLMLLSLILAINLGTGCNNSGQERTPSKYIYKDTIDVKVYNRYILMLVDSIKSLIKERKGPYYPKEFDQQTEIFIDTILVSPRRNRLAFFVITKNSNDKLLSKGDENEFHYNANCFIGQLITDTIWDIRWLTAINLTRYPTKNESSDRIREVYFKLFNKAKDTNGSSLYKYNLDDIRFWDGPLWKSYFGG